MSVAPTAPLPVLKPADYGSDQDVRWCPGCGDYSILAQMKKVCAKLGMDRSKTVFISGIGCSSRFPYYMNTYGFHSIHGRAPTFATGLKLAAKYVGTAFVEIYQNCNIFNDGAFTYATDKTTKTDTTLYLEHGKPLVFGKDASKGVRLHGLNPEVVETKTVKADDLLIHD